MHPGCHRDRGHPCRSHRRPERRRRRRDHRCQERHPGGPGHGRHRDGRRRWARDVRCGWASCRESGGFRRLRDGRRERRPDAERPDVHRQRRPDAERPDGGRLRLLRDGDRRGVRPRCGFRPDAACPARERTGCCPDAPCVRCRRRGRGACPGTWRTDCCRDGGRPDAVPSRPGVPEQRGPQPWVPDVRRAWRRWTEPPELRQPVRRRGPLLRVPQPGRKEPPEPGLQSWFRLPSARREPARAPVVSLPGWPWGRTRALRSSKRQVRRGRRCGVSAQRGPQWWKRRSERIRPVPAVWLLHLWK